jgi:hypothetical protein
MNTFFYSYIKFEGNGAENIPTNFKRLLSILNKNTRPLIQFLFFKVDDDYSGLFLNNLLLTKKQKIKQNKEISQELTSDFSVFLKSIPEFNLKKNLLIITFWTKLRVKQFDVLLIFRFEMKKKFNQWTETYFVEEEIFCCVNKQNRLQEICLVFRLTDYFVNKLELKFDKFDGDGNFMNFLYFKDLENFLFYCLNQVIMYHEIIAFGIEGDLENELELLCVSIEPASSPYTNDIK